MLMAVSVTGALIALIYAWNKYSKYQKTMAEPTGFAKILANKWYVDELYEAIVVKPINWISSFLSRVVDSKLIDGILGKNFKGSLGYTPPCSQGPGQKEYTFTLYAVSAPVTQTGLTGPELLNQITGKILGTAKLTVYYTRKS